MLCGCASFTRPGVDIPPAQENKSDGGVAVTAPNSASIPATAKRPAPAPGIASEALSPGAPEAPPAPLAPPASAPRRNAELLFQAIAAAGSDYRSGGRTHDTGFDCSGLVAFVYQEAYSLHLPLTSRAQSQYGHAVAREKLEVGDLVFFNTQRQPFSHVGIYIGDGKFIHAPKTGSKVRTESLLARYWSTRFDGARRIVPDLPGADYAAAPNKPAVTFR